MQVDEIGLKDGIRETIVTTIDLNNIPNAAPIGIIRKKDDFFIKLFKNSKTYENIFNNNIFVANITYDSLLFVNSIFDNFNSNDFEFILFEEKQYPIIKDSIGFVIFKCKQIEIKNDILFASLTPILVKMNKQDIYAPNRGFNAIIEALVYTTRYKLFRIEKHKKFIQYYLNLAIKCGGAREKEAALIMDKFLFNIYKITPDKQ